MSRTGTTAGASRACASPWRRWSRCCWPPAAPWAGSREHAILALVFVDRRRARLRDAVAAGAAARAGSAAHAAPRRGIERHGRRRRPSSSARPSGAPVRRRPGVDLRRLRRDVRHRVAADPPDPLRARRAAARTGHAAVGVRRPRVHPQPPGDAGRDHARHGRGAVGRRDGAAAHLRAATSCIPVPGASASCAPRRHWARCPWRSGCPGVRCSATRGARCSPPLPSSAR